MGPKCAQIEPLVTVWRTFFGLGFGRGRGYWKTKLVCLTTSMVALLAIE